MNLTLRCQGLSLKKGYNLLIHNLDLVVQPGAAVSLMGGNGVGKTTLLRTLAGFAAPHAGEIAFFDGDTRLETEAVQALRVHLLGHHDALSPSRTVAQELRFQADFLGGDVDAAIARLSLETLLDLETRYLSAGQKRRLSCARLLMARRPLWLLDEPMAPLDAHHRALLADIMQAHLADGGSLIAAVHDPLPFQTETLRLERPTLAAMEAAGGW